MVEELLGKTLQEVKDMAKEAGLELRCTAEDGEGKVATCEFNKKRINVELNQGKVVNSYRG